jgi:hypothetical protein
MENNDAYSRLLEAVENFGWDVFTDIETASVGGNEFTYESSLVSNLTNGTGAGDGAYIGTPIEMLMVGNVGAIRTFSFLSVAVGDGEFYSYSTTGITSAPPAAITATTYRQSVTTYSAGSSTFTTANPAYANGTLTVEYTQNIAPGHGDVTTTYSYEDINGDPVGTPSTFNWDDGFTYVYDLTFDNLAANGVAKVNITTEFTGAGTQLGSIITKTVDLSTL